MDLSWAFQIIPGTIGTVDFILLIGASFFTSMLTAAVGIGGGMLLLAVMAQLLPVPVIVPVHGVVQLGSNTGRSLIMRINIDRRILGYFFVGSLLGAVAGGHLVIALPVMYLQVILACFILFSTWGPKLSSGSSSMSGVSIGGFLSTLLTMFVGATGPFVAVLLKRLGLNKLTHVATMAACMSLQHALKVVVFVMLGFSFSAYIPLMALMIVTGFMGTLVGRRLLDHLSEELFSRFLKATLTILAARLLWKAFEN